MSTASFSLLASEFRRWVEPAVVTADGGKYAMPAISKVRIEVRGDHALALSTDRFVASLSRVRFKPRVEDTTADVAVEAVDLKRIWSIFKAVRSADPSMVLTFREGRMEVACDGYAFDVPTYPADGLPDIRKLITTTLAEGFKSEEPFAVAPERIACFKVAAQRNEPMVLAKTTGRARPVIVRIGEDYIGLLMPVRMAADADAPTPITAGWESILNDTKEDAK